MKKYKCFFIFIILIALFCNFLNAEDLPKNAFNFMGSVFPDFKIDNISLENDIYKVTLLNEAVISFDRQGDWVKIDSSFEPIPETVFPKKVLDSIIEKFENIVKNAGGNVEKTDKWGVKKLAYEIDYKSEGYYVLMTFSCEASLISEIERVANITEEMLRRMIVKL